MTNKHLSYAGVALIIIGLFMPIITLPIVGGVNLLSNGTNELGVMLAVLAAASAILVANDRARDSIYPSIGAAALVIYAFVRLEFFLSRMRETVSQGLQHNPFAGLVQSAVGAVQLQWGWLVLAAGAGLLVYAAFRIRREGEAPPDLWPRDATSRVMAALTLILVLVAPSSDAIAIASAKPSAAIEANPAAAASGGAASADVQSGPGKEEAAYIKDNLQLYDLSAKYQDSVLDGRIPGVDFKIKNNGTRTLSEVDVKVFFYDANDKAISEETYYPVLSSGIEESKPLRPNYIWQQESGQFYEAKDVPSEWQAGKVTASITDIKFAPS
jgi:hypothetical protein